MRARFQRLPWVATAALVTGLGGVRAVAKVPAALDEAQVVAAIVQRDPAIRQARAQVDLAKAGLAFAAPRWSPGAYYSLEHLGKGVHLEQEHELGATATFIAPSAQASRDQASVTRDRQTFAATRRVHDRVVAGLRRYYDIIALGERIVVLEQWRRGLDELLRIAKARVRAGEAPGYEELRIELALRSAQSEIRTAQALHDTQVGALADFLGLPRSKAKFQGSLTPDGAKLEERLDELGDRVSVRDLERGHQGTRDRATRRTWLPSLSFNAGLRMRREPAHQDWGFGVGIGASFPHPKRVRAIKRVAKARHEALRAQIETARFDDRRRAKRAGLLCLALLQERRRYIQEIQEVLEPLERALKAEYSEGQRDVVGLMSVLERSMQSRRYRLGLAVRAREAELEFRDAMGVFEQ